MTMSCIQAMNCICVWQCENVRAWTRAELADYPTCQLHTNLHSESLNCIVLSTGTAGAVQVINI